MIARHTRVIEGGKVIIPAAIRKALDLKPGDSVFMDIDEGAVRIRPLAAAIAQAQAIARRFAPERVLSDELIAERRSEAAHD